MKAGDTYTIPEHELDFDDPNHGHRQGVPHNVTVLGVTEYPKSTGPDPDDGSPDGVLVECSCGAPRWSFTDYPEGS